jgi:integrase
MNELHLVWLAADGLGFPFGPITKLLILTSQRKSEVGGMEWREIDLDRATWTIPGARAKNKRQHVVPLSPQAITIIKGPPRFDSKFVFSPGKTAPSGYSRAKTRLDGIIARLNSDDAIAPWILHDVRRSVASGLAEIGVNLPVIERCLNHVSGSFGGIVGVYQRHDYAGEMRAAMERWGRHVDTSVNGGRAGKIAELRHSAMERSS